MSVLNGLRVVACASPFGNTKIVSITPSTSMAEGLCHEPRFDGPITSEVNVPVKLVSFHPADTEALV